LRFDKFTSDILIIGGGGAAAMAALAARRGGAKVTLISKENSLVGGATIMSAGGTCAVFKPDDSPEIFYNDIMRGGGYLNNPRLTRILAEKSTESILKLEDYDFVLDKRSLAPALMVKKGEGHSWPRGYLDRREGLGFCHALSKALIRSEVDFRPEIVAYKLLANHGQVVGAMGFSLVTGEYLVFNAKAIILATGGLGALYKTTTNSRALTGDGYAMAWDAGTELIDMEMVQFLPLAFPYPKSREGLNIGMCSHFGPGAKLYNGLGERYMEKYNPERMEFATRDVVARANFIEIKEGRGTKNGAIVIDPREHDPDYLKRFKSFHPHIYSMCKEVFGERAANWLEPFEVIPSQHFFMGGVIINENCETSIPGLFAVGEVAGGIHGANRLSGCALTELFVFGDMVGENAMLWVKKRKLLPPIESEVQEIIDQLEEIFSRRQGVRPFEVKQAIKNTMWDHFGPSRDEEGMKKGIAGLKNIQENDIPHLALASHHTRYNRERMEAAEVNLMIKTAILIAHAALSRRESRGSHYRSDLPLPDDKEWLRNIVLRKKSTTGEVDISYKQAGA
jgi:fumarate reductase (CoM/CoB) subunit A